MYIHHPKLSILSSFTHPHLMLNLYVMFFFLMCNAEDDILKTAFFFVHSVKVPKQDWTPLTFIIREKNKSRFVFRRRRKVMQANNNGIFRFG